NGEVSSLRILVSTAKEVLDARTNYTYELLRQPGSRDIITGTAASPFAVGYALESVLQLSADAQQQQQSQQFSDRAQRGVVHFSGDAEPASEPEASREDSAPRGAPRGDSAVDDYA
ncbi:MAG: hypothetical protein ACPH56_07870, partial [Spongiibacter marinus]|uniref:hypothetical protein n=1 Tax=Spongiibacter marinus TaxID=354246 RepID=UPI003C68B18A